MPADNNSSRATAADAPSVDFSTIENPFGTPASFAQAIAEAIERDAVSMRPDHTATALRGSLSRTLKLPEESFLVGSTVSSMIAAVAQTFERCNVGIVVPCPAEYVLALSNTGHSIERIVPSSGHMVPNFESLGARDNELNGVILGNPGYPASRLLPEAVLRSYLEACDWVIVDERSIELALNGVSHAPLVERHKNLVVVQTLSEQYALPGAPVSYCIAHPELIAEISRFYDNSPVSFLPDALASASTLEYPKLDGVRGFLAGEIPWMQTMLSFIPGIEIFPAEANYVMCAFHPEECPNADVVDCASLAERLAEHGCVIRTLDDVAGLKGMGRFCASVRTRPENEQLINALRAILS